MGMSGEDRRTMGGSISSSSAAMLAAAKTGSAELRICPSITAPSPAPHASSFQLQRRGAETRGPGEQQRHDLLQTQTETDRGH